MKNEDNNVKKRAIWCFFSSHSEWRKIHLSWKIRHFIKCTHTYTPVAKLSSFGSVVVRLASTENSFSVQFGVSTPADTLLARNLIINVINLNTIKKDEWATHFPFNSAHSASLCARKITQTILAIFSCFFLLLSFHPSYSTGSGFVWFGCKCFSFSAEKKEYQWELWRVSERKTEQQHRTGLIKIFITSRLRNKADEN